MNTVKKQTEIINLNSMEEENSIFLIYKDGLFIGCGISSPSYGNLFHIQDVDLHSNIVEHALFSVDPQFRCAVIFNQVEHQKH